MRLAVRMPAATLAVAVALSIPGAAAAQAPNDMAVTPDGRYLHTSGTANETFEIDPANGGLRGLEPHLGNNGGLGGRLAIPPDGRFVYTGAGLVTVDGSITRQYGSIHRLSRDAANGVLTHEQTMFGGPWPGSSDIGSLREMELSGDGRHLYALDFAPPAVGVFARDAATGQLTRVQGPVRDSARGSDSATDLAIAPDGRHVYVAGGNGSIEILARDPADGRLSHAGSALGASGEIAVAPDGRRVYVGGPTYHVFTRDPASGALEYLNYFDPSGGSCGSCGGHLLGVSPDGRSVFSTLEHMGTIVEAHPTETGLTTARTYDSGPEPAGRIANATAMAWSPDGRFAYLAIEEYQASEWGTARFQGAPSWAYALKWTADGLEPVGAAQGPPFRRSDMEVSPAGSVTIDGGALYTNDPDVEITVGAAFGTYAFRLSNFEGAFGNATALRLADGLHRRPWRLETGPAGQTLPDRSVRRVHLRFVQSGAIAKQDLSDDIVLDMRAPQLLSARIDRSRLKLKARDNRSGIKRVQLTANRKKPGKERKFKSSLPVGSKARQVYVRVLDGAGNRSKWRSVRRR